MIGLNPIILHNFADDAWATFYTTLESPNPVKFIVALPPGQISYFDWGDGSEILAVASTGSNQIIQKTYIATVAGTKIKIWFSDIGTLRAFYCNSNQLYGSIPALDGLYLLAYFSCYLNQLHGPIPPLSGVGLDSLIYFRCNDNPLDSQIPSLDGLYSLAYFSCFRAQLYGSIPSLDGLYSLAYFRCSSNMLTEFDGGLTGSSTNINLDLSDNALSETAINLLLADSLGAGLATGDTTILTGGTNAVPTGQGIIDKALLLANGVALTTN